VSEVSGIVLVDRDNKIMKEIDRWRVCQGKHIRELAGFDGQRACDRRLRKLIDAGYVRREKILYGVAGIYRVTAKASRVVAGGLPSVNHKIRVEQITHDIAVLDTAIFWNKKHDVEFREMQTEIELHRLSGFGKRKHRPDFIYTKDGKTVCVEVELALKARDRFETNILSNFQNYDTQIWVVPSLNTKIAKILEQNKTACPNIEILELSEIQETENGKT